MQKPTELNATTAERKASEIARYGNRYYPVDQSYDKRVYENTWGNIAKIVFILVLFWIFNGIHWWGVFALGIVDTDALAWYSIGAFIFTVIFLAGMLVSGKYANRKKRLHEFYQIKIAEKIAEENEVKNKAEQEAAHEEKLRKQAERLANKNKQAETKKPAKKVQQATPEVAQQIITNI